MGDDRSKNALLIAASLIAAVRLARDEIKPTPRVLSAVSDSIRLAQMVLAKIERDGG